LAALPDETAFVAELGLDGDLRPVHGVLPAALAARHARIMTIVVAAANYAEDIQVPGMTVIGAENLTEVVTWLRGGPPPHRGTAVPGRR
jgi:magnesium chelatase family protein